MEAEMLKQAKQIKSWGVKHRRHLHQHPEVAMQEKETAQYCKAIFAELGYTVQDCFGYGFIADLDVANATKKIAFRADMDALPMQEQNTHEFVSQNPGVAHMCGHDVHMAIALTTAKLLHDNVEKLQCSVRFIFQPSEEKLPGGALGMIKNDCLKDVDEIYGLHNDPTLPVGDVAIRTGTLMAGGDMFDITITGKGGHAACPQACLDPLRAANFLMTEWNAIPAKVDPEQPPILTISTCHSGDAPNIIPNTTTMSGTARILNTEHRAKIAALMRKTIQELEQQGYKCEFNYNPGYDCVVNQEYGVQRVIAAAEAIVGREHVIDNITPRMVAEDFCYYLQKIPGAFYFLGSRTKDASLHAPDFDVDEDVIPIGAALMAQLAL